MTIDKKAVFKIFVINDWEQFRSSGFFKGSAHDIRDGFIHLSKIEQLKGVLSRYYADHKQVVIASLTGPDLLAELKWETASNGDTYPHLYRPIKLDEISDQKMLSPNEFSPSLFG